MINVYRSDTCLNLLHYSRPSLKASHCLCNPVLKMSLCAQLQGCLWIYEKTALEGGGCLRLLYLKQGIGGNE